MALPVTPSTAPVAPTQPVQLDAFAPFTTPAPATPSGSPTALASSLMTRAEAFQARAAQMQGLARSVAGIGPALPGALPPTAGAQPPAAPVAGSGAAAGTGQGNVFAIMLDSFNFAIETQLVARAATQFTGSVNTLMKGQ